MNKFILSENIKHILNEKYLLDERYILTEATSMEQVIKAWNDKVVAALPQLKDRLEKVKNSVKVGQTTAINTLKSDTTVLDNAKKSVENARKMPKKDDGSIEELKSELIAYYNAANNLYKELQSVGGKVSTNQDIENNLKDLDKIINATAPWDIANQNNAIRAYSSIDTILPQFLDEWKKKNLGTITAEKVGYFRDLCDKIIEALNDLPDKLIKNFENLDEAGQDDYYKYLTEQVKPALETISKLNENTIAFQFPQKTKQLETNLKTLQNVIEAKNVSNNLKRAMSEKEDWATRYSTCRTKEDFDSFWNDYFTEEWGDKARFVKKWGNTFLEDLKKVGFDEINNALVKFLKTKVIYNLIGTVFNYQEYVEIHNAVANDYLRGSDLKASQTSTYGAYNLIFNPNLYNNYLNIKDYLKAQSILRTKSHSLEGNIQAIWGASDGHAKILTNLMYIDGDDKDFNNAPKLNGALRSVTEVNQILEQITGSSIEDKIEATNQNLNEILRNIEQAASGNKKFYTQILAYLVMACKFTGFSSAVDDAEKKVGTNKLWNLGTSVSWPDKATADDYDNLLQFKNLTFDNKQFVTLILELAEKVGIYTPATNTKGTANP